MRTILPFSRSDSYGHRTSASFIASLAFLLILFPIFLPSTTNCQTPARYRIQSTDFLRAPDSLNATSFSYLVQFLFDRQGSVLIPDWKNGRLLRFSEKGEFISAAPLKKTGGEDTLRRVFLVNCSPAGLIYAMEPAVTKRVLILDQSGALKEELNYQSKDFGIWDYAFIGEHQIAASINELTVFPGRRLERRYSVAMVNLANWSRTTVRVAAPREGGDFSDDFTNIVSSEEGRFFFGLVSEKEYRILIHDKFGKTIKMIKRDYTPSLKKTGELARASKDRQQAKLVAQKLGLKRVVSNTTDRYLFAINWLALDSFDNLWVFTGKGEKDGVLSVDLFDKNGEFKKSFFLENKELASQRHSKIRIRGNFLYAIVGNENEQEEHIFRYELPAGVWQ